MTRKSSARNAPRATPPPSPPPPSASAAATPSAAEGAAGAAAAVSAEELRLLQYVSVIWRNRWFIGVFCLTVAIGTYLYNLIAPRIYVSTATVLVTEDSTPKGLGSTLALSAGIAKTLPGLNIPSFTQSTDMVLGILKSRTMAQHIVERFQLKKRFEIPFDSLTIKHLESMVEIVSTKEQFVSITVESEDPDLAAAMGNEFVHKLNEMLLQLETSKATRQRKFIEARLSKNRIELQQAEEDLWRFQKEHRTISIEDQTRGLIEAAADIQSKITMAEVEIEMARTYMTEENPELVTIKRALEEMRRQRDSIARSRPPNLPEGYAGPDAPEVALEESYLPLDNLPELGIQLARLLRNLKVKETVNALLTQEFEQSKIAEARDTPSVQVMDRAIPADINSKPRRLFNTAIATAASVVLALLAVFAWEYAMQLRRKLRGIS